MRIEAEIIWKFIATDDLQRSLGDLSFRDRKIISLNTAFNSPLSLVLSLYSEEQDSE